MIQKKNDKILQIFYNIEDFGPSKKNIFCIHKIIEKKINGIRSILTKASIPWTERILEESHWYHSTIRSEHYCSKYQKTALGDSERILWESLWISETMPFMQINNLFIWRYSFKWVSEHLPWRASCTEQFVTIVFVVVLQNLKQSL